MGRKVGSAPGYQYSEELAQSVAIWTPTTLDAWLRNPEKVIPGKRMGYQLEDRKERAARTGCLATFK